MAYAISSEDMIEALKESGGLIAFAAKRLGCAQSTIRNRASRVQSVRQVIIDAREELKDDAELSLRAAVLRGEPWAVTLALKTIGRDRGYTEKTEVEMYGKNGKPLELTVVEKIVDITERASLEDDSDRDSVIEGTVRLLSE